MQSFAMLDQRDDERGNTIKTQEPRAITTSLGQALFSL
jgi:hypothetical protein